MAGRIALDLKQFKHRSSDKDCTTLEHRDGHTLTLAHKHLSKDYQDQLQALAKGGEVKKYDKKDEKKSPNTIVASKASHGIEAANKAREIEEMPNGATIVIPDKDEDKKYGKVIQKFAEGDEVQDPQQQIQDMTAIQMPQPADPQAMKEAELQQEIDKVQHQGSLAQQYDPVLAEKAALDRMEWKKVDAQADVQAKIDADNKAITDAKTLNDQRVAQGLAPKPIPGEPQVPGSPQVPELPKADELPKAPAQAQYGMPGANSYEGLMQQGYQNKLGGINQEAAAQAQLGQEQEALLNKQAEAQQNAQIAYKQNYDALDKERQAHIQDIQNGYIDPNKYWTGDSQGNGSHSKIASGIGMILAGFNPTNQPNAAINFLNHQMEQNLNAQKANLDTKNNLLSANLRQFGNLKDATDMTRLMQADVVHNQLMAAAAKAQTPMAKAAALKAAGDLQMQYAPIQQQLAMRTAMTHLANGNGDPSNTAAAEQMIAYARMTNPEMAKEMETRLIPGVGMAKLPVPQDARAEIIGKQNFNKMASHYVDWVKHNSGSLSPAKINEGATMAAELQGAYRNAVKGGVYKEGEQQFIEKLIPSNPAQFASSIRTLPKVENLIQSNNSQLNSLKAGYGLPQAQQQSGSQAATQWAMANPKDHRSAKILQHLGKK